MRVGLSALMGSTANDRECGSAFRHSMRNTAGTGPAATRLDRPGLFLAEFMLREKSGPIDFGDRWR